MSSIFRLKKKRLGRSRSDRYQAELEAFQERYKLSGECLGEGNFAQVRKAIDRETNQTVAVKIIKKQKLRPKILTKAKNEIKILQRVHHKNIVKLLDNYETREEIILVLEYLEGGELFNRVMKQEKRFSEDQVKKIFYQICLALKHCNDRGICHRDIKPQNIVFCSENSLDIKIIDFDVAYARVRKKLMQSFQGSPHYVAPEIVSGLVYGKSCDYWSLGVVLYFISSDGVLPFHHQNIETLLSIVKKGIVNFEPKENWKNVNPDLIDLISKLLNKNPTRRFGFKDIMNHPWMENVGPRKVSTSSKRKDNTYSTLAISVFDDDESLSDIDSQPFGYVI